MCPRFQCSPGLATPTANGSRLWPADRRANVLACLAQTHPVEVVLQIYSPPLIPQATLDMGRAARGAFKILIDSPFASIAPAPPSPPGSQSPCQGRRRGPCVVVIVDGGKGEPGTIAATARPRPTAHRPTKRRAAQLAPGVLALPLCRDLGALVAGLDVEGQRSFRWAERLRGPRVIRRATDSSSEAQAV